MMSLPRVSGNPVSSCMGRRPRPDCAVRTDRAVAFLVDLMLVWAVTASIAYWLVLLLRLAGWWWYPICASLLVPAVCMLRPDRIPWRSLWRGRWALLLFVLCLTSAAINVFTNRPDSDDIAFSHRAIQAATDLSRPFALGDTAQDIAGLPPLTPLHVFTSVEVSTALVARGLHLAQVAAIHQGLGTLVNLMLPLVYFLLLRFCRVSMPAAIFGTLAVLAAFIMCGNGHRDWGNFTIMRSWQGKCILMALMMPLGLLYSLRFVQYGRRADFLRLHAANAAGIGLSGTGLFLMPFVIGVAAAAAWLASGKRRRPAGRRMCQVASVLLLPAAVAVLPWVGLLPKLGDITFYQSGGWPRAYLDNLALVFDVPSVVFYVALLGTVLLMARRRAEVSGLLIYLVLLTLLVLAPGPRDLLMRVVTPGAYWRLADAFVAPFWAGLAAAGLYRWMGRPGSGRILAAGLAILLVGISVWAKTPTLNRTVLAWPGLKFSREELAAVREISRATSTGMVVLADYRVVTILGLMRPDVRFIVTRPVDTSMVFSNAGMKAAGALRAATGMALATYDFSRFEPISAGEAWPDLGEIIAPVQCDPGVIRHALGLGKSWNDEVRAGYRLWRRSRHIG